MKFKRNNDLLVEPPALATGDIAFNLIVFFLVCASVQPDSGRKQEIPRSEKEQKEQQVKNIEVSLTAKTVAINGVAVSVAKFASRLERDLSTKSRPGDKVVVVKSAKDTPYHFWILVTGLIEQAGGTITLQLEEEQIQVLPN